MPFDFDSEFDTAEEVVDSEETAPVPTETLIGRLTQPSEDPLDDLEEPEQEYMGEVDKRLEVASYYRELLRASLFTDGGSSGKIVEREIRAFVRERLEILLSIRAPAPVTPFSEEEIQALKMIASKLLGKPQLLQANPPARPPAPKPALNAAPAPASSAKPKPSAAPATRPPARRERPPAISKTEPKAASPKQQKPTPRPKDVSPDAPAFDEKIVSVDGRDVRLRTPRRQRPAGAIPFPQDLTAVTAAKAQEQVANASAANPLAAIATKFLTNNQGE